MEVSTLVSIVIAIEDELGVELPGEQLDQLKTIGDIVQCFVDWADIFPYISDREERIRAIRKLVYGVVYDETTVELARLNDKTPLDEL